MVHGTETLGENESGEHKITNFFCKKEKVSYLCRKDYLKLLNKMKKFYLLLMLSLASLSIKAQNYMDDLDCVKLQGTWVVTSVTGTFKGGFWGINSGTSLPSSIQFNDDNYTRLIYESGYILNYKGYFISAAFGNTGKFCIHFVQTAISSSYDSRFINLQIEQFRGDTMTLASYDGSARMELRKEDTSFVSSAKATETTNGKAYDINGIEISDPNSTKGIVIQDGQKVLR